MSAGARYMTTPSQIHMVGRAGSWPAFASASSSESRVKSTGTKRMSVAAGVRRETRARLSRCESGWSTSKTTTSRSSGMRHARPSRPAPRMTSCGARESRTASSMATVRATMSLDWFRR